MTHMLLLVFGDFDVELQIRRVLVSAAGSAGDTSRARGDAAGIRRDASGVAVRHHRRIRAIDSKWRLKSRENEGFKMNDSARAI